METLLGSRTPDNLDSGANVPNVTRSVVVKSGQSLKRGTVMSEVSVSLNGVTTGTANGGNTGGGTVTDVSLGTKAKVGTYTIRCTVAPTAYDSFLPQFEIKDPDGIVIGTAVQATAFTSPQINLLINDGSPDFVAGDKFTVAVIAGSAKAVGYDSTATNGGASPLSVLAEDVDATDADTAGIVNETGEFNETALIFVNEDDGPDNIREIFRQRGIHLKVNQAY